MKNAHILFLITCSLLAASCKSTSENITSETLLPLKVGDLWLYETKMYNDSGIVTKISTDTIRVDSILSMNGSQWFKLYQTNFLRLADQWENRSDGVWTYDSSAKKTSLSYKFPSSTGKSYIVKLIDTTYSSGSWSHSETTDSIASIKENVTTPSGNFICYHYIVNFDYEEQSGDVGTGTFYSEDIYFAPNIGLVKLTVPMSVYNGNPNGFYLTSELKKYTLK